MKPLLFALVIVVFHSQGATAASLDVGGKYTLLRTCSNGAVPTDTIAEANQNGNQILLDSANKTFALSLKYINGTNGLNCIGTETGSYAVNGSTLKLTVGTQVFSSANCGERMAPSKGHETEILELKPLSQIPGGFYAIDYKTKYGAGGSCSPGTQMILYFIPDSAQ